MFLEYFHDQRHWAQMLQCLPAVRKHRNVRSCADRVWKRPWFGVERT
jgi:hypothetical protein